VNSARALLAVFLGDLRRGPGTALASIFAMAVGVAVFVAIHLAGSAARSSFVSAVEAIAGRGTHEVSASGGVPEERFAEFASLDVVEAAQPVVEGFVPVLEIRRGKTTVSTDAPPLRLLGIDSFSARPFFAQGDREPVISGDEFVEFLTVPGTTILPRRWAAEVDCQTGDTLVVAAAGRVVHLDVIGIYDLEHLGEAARDSAVLDVASAQEALDRVGRLDRIDLRVDKGREDEVRKVLVSGERLDRPGQRGERVAKMVDAFRLNLLALGGLALVVGAMLVYNAAQFRVVRRARLLGQLRCLGVTRKTMIFGVLAEIVALGVVGGALGVLLGALLAQLLVTSIARTITDLYTFLQVDAAPLGLDTAIVVVLATALISAIAGWFPALDAARTAPRMVGLRSRGELRFRDQIPRLVVVSIVASGIGYGLLLMEGPWWWGILASFVFLCAGAAILPPVMALTLPRLQRQIERLGMVGLAIAVGSLHRSLTRTGSAAAVLGVTLSMTIGLLVMISSFEKEVRGWIYTTLCADIFIADASQVVARDNSRIPASAVDAVRQTPGVRAVDSLRGIELPYADRTLYFCGLELPIAESRIRFEFLEGDRQTSIDRALSGDAIISEPLSRRYDLHLGDTLVLPGAHGDARFTIAGVFRDFSYDRGYGLTGHERYVDAFGDTGIRNLGLYVEPGIEKEDLASVLRRRLAKDYFLRVRSNSDLREEVLEVFGRTFAVTHILRLIATVLALVGIAVTLSGLFLERAVEIATLRAVGASRRQVVRVFAAESLVMAAYPVLLSLPLGCLLAWILIHVVNLRAFGWTILLDWPWGSVLLTCVLALVSGLIATVVPAALLKRQSIAMALREE
jgi:putative ABC transport system permease protein